MQLCGHVRARMSERSVLAAAAAYALIDRRVHLGRGSRHDLPPHVLQAAASHSAGASQQQDRQAGGAFSPICLDCSSDDGRDDGSASDVSLSDSSSADGGGDNETLGATVDAKAEDDDAAAGSVVARKPSEKTWTTKEFPDGYEPGYVNSLRNLNAAQEWSCPCQDRHNCIGADRINVLQLYEFRLAFRSVNKKSELRDAMRRELQGHYDAASGAFTRSFVVGPCGDCCAAAAGLARGLSFGTFANARADLVKERDWCAERRSHKQVRGPGAQPPLFCPYVPLCCPPALTYGRIASVTVGESQLRTHSLGGLHTARALEHGGVQGWRGWQKPFLCWLSTCRETLG